MKTVSADDQKALDNVRLLLIAFIEELASAINRDGLIRKPVFRWRVQNVGQFAQDRLVEPWIRDESYGRAFYLSSYQRFRAAVYASPLGPHVHKQIGPSAMPIILSLEDFALRTADVAIIVSGDRVRVDLKAVQERYDDLMSLVQSTTADIEIVILLRGFWLRDGPLELGEGSSMHHLSDQELLRLIGIGLIPPRLVYDQPAGGRPYPFIQVGDTDRVAFRRRVTLDNSVTGNDSVALNPNSRVDEDLVRLTDSVGLIESHWYSVVGWVARGIGNLLGGGAFMTQGNDALPRPAFITQPGFWLDQHRGTFVRRWQQLLRAERDPGGAGARTAARRIGFAVSRRHHEDRLLDGVIALEALLNDVERARGIADTIRSRVGSVWPASATFDRREAMKRVRAAYRARNQIAHGNSAQLDTLERVANDVIQVARVVTGELLDRRDLDGSYEVDWKAASAATKG